MLTGVPANCDIWSDSGTWVTPPYTGQPLSAGLSLDQDPIPDSWLTDTPTSCGPVLQFPWLCWAAVQFPETWDAVDDMHCDPRCVHTQTLIQDIPPKISDMCYDEPHPSATCPSMMGCDKLGVCQIIDVVVVGSLNVYSGIQDQATADAQCAIIGGQTGAPLFMENSVHPYVLTSVNDPGSGGWHAVRCTGASTVADALPRMVTDYGARMLRTVDTDMSPAGYWENPSATLVDGGQWDWALTDEFGNFPPASGVMWSGCDALGVGLGVGAGFDCNGWAGGVLEDAYTTDATLTSKPHTGWIGGTDLDVECGNAPHAGLLCWAPVMKPTCAVAIDQSPPAECFLPKYACNPITAQCEHYFWDAIDDFGCDPGCVQIQKTAAFGVVRTDLCYTDWAAHGCVDGHVCASSGWSAAPNSEGKCVTASTFMFISESTVSNAADLGGETDLDAFCMAEANKPGSITKGLMDAGYIPTASGSPLDGFRNMRCQSVWGGGPTGVLGSAPYYMFGSTWGMRTTNEALDYILDGSMLGWLATAFKLYDQFGVERGHHGNAWTGCASGVGGTFTSWDGGSTYNTCGDWTDGTAGARGEMSSTGSPVLTAGVAGPWWLGPINFDTRSKTCDTPGYRRLCWAPIDTNTFPICEDSGCAPGWRCGPLHACVKYDGWNCEDTATGAVECDAAGTVSAFTPSVRDACLAVGSVGGCGGGATCNAQGFCQLCVVDGDCTALDARFGCDAGVCKQRDWDAFNDFDCAGSCVHTATLTGTYDATLGDMCYRWLDSEPCIANDVGYEVGMEHHWCDNYGQCRGPPSTYLVTSPEGSGSMDGHQGDDLGAVAPGYECEVMARAGVTTGALDVAQWYHAAAYARTADFAFGDRCLFRNIPDESPYKDSAPLIDYFHPTYYYNAIDTSLGTSMLDIFGNSPGGVPIGGGGWTMYDMDGVTAGSGARVWIGCRDTNNVEHTSTPSAALNLWTCSSGIICASTWGWDKTTTTAGRAAMDFGVGGVTQDRWICPPGGALDLPLDCGGGGNTRWMCWGVLNTGGPRMRVYDYVDRNCDYACDIRPADVPGLAPRSTVTSFVIPSISDLCFVSGEVARCSFGTCNAFGQCA